MKILTAFLLIALSLPFAALADEATPLLYNRDRIAIIHKGPVAPLPWQGEGKAVDNPRLKLIFDVEVRDATVFYKQQGWFSLSGPSEMNGILLAFSAPGISPIMKSTQYSPMDILFIDKEGKIIQIAPSIVLSELAQDIYPQKPVLAFLLLKGGTCTKFGIAPGDEVDYKIFSKPPIMMSAPPVS